MFPFVAGNIRGLFIFIKYQNLYFGIYGSLFKISNLVSDGKEL